MKPAKEKYYRGLFAIAAVYDVLLGITFTFFPARAFDALGIRDKLPAFGGYLTLLGAFVLVIGIAYVLIARGDLQRNRDLILIGTLYKLAYSAIGILLLGGGQPSAHRLRRAVRRGRRGLFRVDGRVLCVPEKGNQKLKLPAVDFLCQGRLRAVVGCWNNSFQASVNGVCQNQFRFRPCGSIRCTAPAAAARSSPVQKSSSTTSPSD